MTHDLIENGQGDLEHFRKSLLQYLKLTEHHSSSNSYRKAAVLVLLLWHEDRWELIFTKRTDLVQTHKGQVSFPGGVHEAVDESLEQTALREAYEEIGLSPDCVDILGRLPVMQTVTGFEITPIVGWIKTPVSFVPNPDEVNRVFSIPLSWLQAKSNWGERLYTRSNGTQEMVIFYAPYEGEVLWGATARMVWQFIQAISWK